MPCVFSYEFQDLTLNLPETELESQLETKAGKTCAEAPTLTPNRPTSVDCEKNINSKSKEVLSSSTCCGEHLNANEKKLDFLLCQFWEDAQEKGLFRYKHQKLPSKIIPGQFRFFAQLNTDRAEKRRKPQLIQTVNQSFDPQQFNFNKVKPDEIILQLKPWWSCNQMKKLENENADVANNDNYNDYRCGSTSKKAVCLTHDDLLDSDESDHKILINASPLEYGNVLLVPFLPSNCPQIITPQSLRIAMEFILLSRSRNFRVGFNSLCAYASVNHCHFHAYYLSHRLYLEHAKLKEVKGPCMELCDYPAPGFVFVLTSADLKNENQFASVVEQVFKLISYLQVNELPHNLYLTRGGSVDSVSKPQLSHQNNCNSEEFDAVRIFVWARSPSLGDKVFDAFNPALCELAGHFPIKNAEKYEAISEEFIIKELEQITVESFNTIRNQVIELYS